jgi:hypothetical protein
MKALELKTILEFMLASANLRPDCNRREKGVYVELVRGGMNFTAIQDGILTMVKTRPKVLFGEPFTIFMPIEDIKNILPSLAYEVKENSGTSTVYITKSKQPLSGVDSLRFEVGGWFDAHQGNPIKHPGPNAPIVRTNNSDPVNRQQFLKSFDPLCSHRSAIADEPTLNGHRSRVFNLLLPRFNLLEVSKTVFY